MSDGPPYCTEIQDQIKQTLDDIKLATHWDQGGTLEQIAYYLRHGNYHAATKDEMAKLQEQLSSLKFQYEQCRAEHRLHPSTKKDHLDATSDGLKSWFGL